MANKPILQTSADLTASQTTGQSALVMPSGVILPYGGHTAPDGWLACNGGEYSKTQYASLFAAIGVAYGETNGSGSAGTTHFRVPDFRGRFPRFNDSMFSGIGASRDPGRQHGSPQGQATAKNSLSVSGGTATGTFPSVDHAHTQGSLVAAVGASGSDINSISYRATGAFFGYTNVAAYTVFGNGGATSASRTMNHYTEVKGSVAGLINSFLPGSFPGMYASVSSTAASLGAGDSETRPINLAINAIIKI